ncbi:MAG: hypothetical protein ACLQNG_10505 [Acidimicrobiales bacterium]|jgi:hypothetical protein
MWGAAPILAAGTTTLTSGQMDEVWVVAVLSGVLAYAFAVYSRRATGTYPWRVPAVVWGIFGVLVPVLSLLLEAVARLTTRPVRPPAAGPYGPGGYVGANSAHAAPGSPGQDAGVNPGWPPPAEPGARWEPPSSPDQVPAGASPWQQPSQPQGATSPAAPPWPPPLGPEAFQPPPGQPYAPQPGQPYTPQPPHAGPGPTPPWQVPSGTPPAGGAQPGLAGPQGWTQPLPYVPAVTPPPLFGWYPDPTGRHEERYWDGRHWSHRVSDNSVRSDDPLHPTPDAGDPVAAEAPRQPPVAAPPVEPDDATA